MRTFHLFLTNLYWRYRDWRNCQQYEHVTLSNVNREHQHIWTAKEY